MKIEQITQSLIRQFHVTKQLSLKDRMHLSHSFEFTDNQILHKYINAKTFFKLETIIYNRYNHLSLYIPFSFCQLMAKTRLVHTF